MRWQVWIALLVYVLLRYLSYLSKWAHSFTRLFTIVRAVLWSKIDLLDFFDKRSGGLHIAVARDASVHAERPFPSASGCSFH